MSVGKQQDRITKIIALESTNTPLNLENDSAQALLSIKVHLLVLILVKYFFLFYSVAF